MRVRRFGTPDDLICEEVPDPVPNPRQVVIATEAVGVHFADLLMIAGRYQVRPEPPLTPGFEAAGRVIALGSEVDQVGLGDLVVAQPWYGAYAEQVAVDANRAYPVPEGVDPAVAAAGFVAYATAHHALFDRAGLRSGETLLVSGATGGVGTAAVQIGVASGATVIAAVGDPAKETPALLLGATHAVRYGGPVSLEDAVGSFTAGRGADVVLDVVGGEVAEACLEALTPLGRFLVVGFAEGRIPAVSSSLVMERELSLLGVFWGKLHERDHASVEAAAEWIFAMMARGSLRMPIDSVYPLEDAAVALRRIAARDVLGRCVLDLRKTR